VLRIRDVYPGSRILIFAHPGSRISDPKTETKRVVKKISGGSHKYHITENYFIFELVKKKFGPIYKEFYNFLPKKLSISSQKYRFGIFDPGSGKNLFRIPDPVSKRHGSRIRIRNTDFYPCARHSNNCKILSVWKR
jgi:hypothetical protein